jgi:hypothetical protein
MTNLGWTCPTCKTNWAPSVLKCDCGPIDAIGVPMRPPQPYPPPQPYGSTTSGSTTMDRFAWVARDTRSDVLQYGPGGTA